MKPKVLLTRLLPEQAVRILQERVDLEINPHDRVMSEEELQKGIIGKDALLCLLTDRIDSELMDINPKLKVISNYAVGFNNIDVVLSFRFDGVLQTVPTPRKCLGNYEPARYFYLIQVSNNSCTSSPHPSPSSTDLS